MKNIWTVMSKEFKRFFTDRRMVIMTLMPAILIYVVYSFMGTALESVFSPDEGYTPGVYVINEPDSFAAMTQGGMFNIKQAQQGEAADIKEKIKNKENNADILIVFPQDFDALVDSYDAVSHGSAAPNIEMYYNSTEPNSAGAFSALYAIFDYYESSLANKFDINRDVESSDLATAEEQSATFIAMMMPMLLMIFLISGCTGLALESITGEKERGTLATLLVSPLKRSELAIGKILSLAVLSFLSGIATAFATVLSLPNLAGGTDTIDTNIYSATDYVLLGLVILSVLLLMVAMLSIVSAFSKTVKEAGQATTPVMILVMVVGVTGMFGSTPSDTLPYFIPLYGSVQSMAGIFSLDYDMTNIAITCVSSLIYACIGGFILTKMFNSEKVMFSR